MVSAVPALGSTACIARVFAQAIDMPPLQDERRRTRTPNWCRGVLCLIPLESGAVELAVIEHIKEREEMVYHPFTWPAGGAAVVGDAVVGAAQTLVLGQAGDPVSLLAAGSFYLIDVPTRLLPSEVALVAALAVAVPACAGVVAARRTAVVRPSVALRAE